MQIYFLYSDPTAQSTVSIPYRLIDAFVRLEAVQTIVNALAKDGLKVGKSKHHYVIWHPCWHFSNSTEETKYAILSLTILRHPRLSMFILLAVY